MPRTVQMRTDSVLPMHAHLTDAPIDEDQDG